MAQYGIDEADAPDVEFGVAHLYSIAGDPLVGEHGFPIQSHVLGEHFHHTVAMHLELCMDEFSLVVREGGRSDGRRFLVLTEPVQDQVGRFCSFNLVKRAAQLGMPF